MKIRSILKAQLASAGTVLDRRKKALAELDTKPCLTPEIEWEKRAIMQEEIIDAAHLYQRMLDRYRAICSR